MLTEADAWIALPLSIMVTFMWRALGVLISGRMQPDSDLFLWIHCVAYALLAGLVSRMLILPTGVLEFTEDWIRLISGGIGLTVFFCFRRNLLLGILAGIISFFSLQHI